MYTEAVPAALHMLFVELEAEAMLELEAICIHTYAIC